MTRFIYNKLFFRPRGKKYLSWRVKKIAQKISLTSYMKRHNDFLIYTRDEKKSLQKQFI